MFALSQLHGFNAAAANAIVRDKSMLVCAIADGAAVKAYPQYDISETGEATWEDYFEEYGARNSIQYSRPVSPPGSVSTGTLTEETVPFTRQLEYYLFAYAAYWAGDMAQGEFEFKDASDNVVFALKLVKGTNYCTDLYYGTNLGSLTQATNTGTTNSIVIGSLAFSDSAVAFTPVLDLYSGEHTDSWSFSVDTTGITKVTFSDVIATSNYSGGGPAQVIFRKLGTA